MQRGDYGGFEEVSAAKELPIFLEVGRSGLLKFSIPFYSVLAINKELQVERGFLLTEVVLTISLTFYCIGYRKHTEVGP